MRAPDTAFAPRRSALPLGLALGLHLLLVLAWLGRTPPPPDSDNPLVSVLVQLRAPRPRAEPAAPASKPAPPLRARTRPAPGLSMPAPASAAPEPVADAPEPVAAAPAPEPFAGAAPSSPSLSADSELLRGAKRAAGPIDRALRGGKSEIPDEAATRWAKFRRDAGGAHVAPVFAAESRDRYTSPDGVVIYRARQGRRETCRQTGSVNFLPGGAAGGNLAGNVPCPKGAEWQRY